MSEDIRKSYGRNVGTGEVSSTLCAVCDKGLLYEVFKDGICIGGFCDNRKCECYIGTTKLLSTNGSKRGHISRNSK